MTLSRHSASMDFRMAPRRPVAFPAFFPAATMPASGMLFPGSPGWSCLPYRMTRALIIVACLVVILAGLKASSTLVVPFLLAAFLAILLAPPFAILKQKGMPGAVALVVMIFALGVLGVLAVTILKTSLDQFTAALPTYDAGLRV